MVTTKTKTPPKEKKDEVVEKEVTAEATPDSPLPLLDLSDAAVKKMIKAAKKRGYVTHDEINAVMPLEEVFFDQIEDIYAMLNEMVINVVDSEETNNEEGDDSADDDESEGGEVAEVQAKTPAK